MPVINKFEVILCWKGTLNRILGFNTQIFFIMAELFLTGVMCREKREQPSHFRFLSYLPLAKISYTCNSLTVRQIIMELHRWIQLSEMMDREQREQLSHFAKYGVRTITPKPHGR